MTSCSIVFKKSDAVNLGAVTLWQEKYGFLRPSFRFAIIFIFNVLAACLAFWGMYSEEEFEILGAIVFIVLQTLVFTFLIDKTLKTKIVPEMAKNADLRIRACSDKTEVTLRDEDFEVKTQYKKINYFYDEVKKCFDMGTFSIIVVDEYAYPIIISYISLTEGDREAFSAILKEKLQEKYERGV